MANFTAKVGQVVTQTLFSESIDYKHIYKWSLGDPSTFSATSGDTPSANADIWDCIRFTNPMDMPLTAAPIEFIQQGRISGTNDLRYTPSKTECTVQMGRAINFVTSQSCKVVKQEVVSYPSESSKTGMRSVTKNSCIVKLSVKNPSDKAVTMEITQRVKGNITQMGPDGSYKSSTGRSGRYLDLDNTLTWKITIEPHATRELECSYDRIN